MANNVKRKGLILFSILLVILPLLFYLYSRFTQKKTFEEITLAVGQQPAFALVYVADKQGYFAEEKLKINFQKHILGKDALNDVINGKADLATVYDIATINQINRGSDLAILTSLHNSDRNHAIATFKNNGVQLPSDLKGKTIGITKGSSTEFFLYSFLEDERIDFSNIKVISIEPQNMIPALESNTVNAVVLFNPYIYNFQKKYGNDKLTFLYSDSYKEMSLLVGKKDYILQNRLKVIKVLKALFKAESFIETNKEESMKMVDEWLDNYELDGVQNTWNIFNFTLTLNNKLLTMLERESWFYANSGIHNSNTPYLRKYIFTDYLKQVKPEGVTLF